MARNRRTRFLIAFSAMIVAVGLLVGLSFRGSMVYYLTVGEYLDTAGNRPDPVRVNGRVAPGSIRKKPGILGVQFAITDGVRSLPVYYDREVPDTFFDGAEVVVEGDRDDQGTFQAHLLLAKCPSKYESQDPAEAPH